MLLNVSYMRKIIAIFMVLVAIAPLTYAIDYSMSCDSGSTSISINAGIDDQVSSSTVLSQDVLQNRISGGGNFSEAHSVKNCAGHKVTVGVNLKNATSYTYSYALSPGNINISASESLDVGHARFIDAYAIASAPNSENAPSGDTAGSETLIENGALIGYSNGASVANGMLSTHQEFTKASGDTVYVKSWGPDHIEHDITSPNNYSNFQVDVNVTKGTIANYNGSSSISDLIQIGQSGHITGQFVNHVPIKEELRRTSNYGSQFDLRSGFTANLSGSENSESWNPKIYSQIVYYVDQADPNANRIQEAIDAARKGDGIKISEGQYYENVSIDKSLFIQGAGVGKTIINPADSISDDSIITVGKDAFVLLGGISLTNGHARKGGAIKNEGTLLLNDYDISYNTAKYGGGIYNVGELVLGHGTVSNNCANQDGGGVYNKGDLAILGSDISFNKAKYGGGVYNLNGGNVSLEYGNIGENSAIECGGGVWNDGLFVMDAGNITYNNAKNGGGVYNKELFCLMNGSISSNVASSGGGVRNDGVFAMYRGQINSNFANNGGAVFNKRTFLIHNGTISDNDAHHNGGAIYNDGGSITLNGGDISYNYARKDGGIHSVYKFKKKGIKGNIRVVHDNQNNNIGWCRDWSAVLSIICAVAAVGILATFFAILTVGIDLYITAGALAGMAGLAGIAGVAELISAVEVITVTLCVGLVLLTLDAIAWAMGMEFAERHKR